MDEKRRHLTITIDGPAGSGKSTLERRLARELGLLYLDTGAMYRAVTWRALEEGTDLEDEAALTALACGMCLDVRGSPDGTRVTVDGRNVSEEIRTPRVTGATHHIARVGGVRARMVQLQRDIARRGGVVIEGRDIGTVVLPGAEYKFYLDANIKERARRRHGDLENTGQAATREDVERDVRARDERDSTRDIAPLRVPDGAVILDCTSMSVEEEVAAVKKALGMEAGHRGEGG